ncbi:MAG TPA: GAF domain-containing protein [Candidatus Xenobia bacterium]
MSNILNPPGAEREAVASASAGHPLLAALGQVLNLKLWLIDERDQVLGREDGLPEVPAALLSEARRNGRMAFGHTLGRQAAAMPLPAAKAGAVVLALGETHDEATVPGPFRGACEQLARAQPQLAQAADDLLHEQWLVWREGFEGTLVRLHENRVPLSDMLHFVAHQACKALHVSVAGAAVWERQSHTVLGWALTDEDPRQRSSFQALLETFSLRLTEEPPESGQPSPGSWPVVYGLELKGSHDGLLLLRPADMQALPLETDNLLPAAMSAVSTGLQYRGRLFVTEVSRTLMTCLRAAGDELDDATPHWSHDDIRSFFSNVGLALSSALDLKGLLRVIVEHAVRLTRSDGGSIYLISDNQVVVEARTGFEESHSKPPMRVGERFLQSARGLVSVLTGDAVHAHRNGPGAWPGPVGSYLGVPLVFQNDVVGVLNLYMRERRPHRQEDIEMLAAFVSHATLAIENARAFEFEQRRAQEVTLLFLAARAIGQCQTLTEVLETGADQMTRVAEVNRCLIMLLDTQGQDFCTAASRGLSEDQREFFSYYRMGVLELEPRFVDTLSRGKNYLFTSEPPDCPPLQKLFDLLPSSTAMLVPLLGQESLLGLIWLDDSRIAHNFTTAQSRLVQALAIHLGTALHRARLHEHMERNLRQIRTLYEVSTALAGAFMPDKVDELVVQKAFELMRHLPCALLAQDEMTKAFELAGHMALAPALQDVSLLRCVAAPALRSKKTLLGSVDASEDDAETSREVQAYHQRLSDERIQTYLCIPLVAKRKVVGALIFLAPTEHRFSDEETQLIHGFASQVAMAIEGSRLNMVVRNKVRELATLFEVGKAVTGSLRLDQVMDAIVHSVRTATASDAIAIMLLDSIQRELSVSTSVGLARSHRRTTVKIGEGFAGLSAQSGRVISIQDTEATAPQFPNAIRQDGMKTIMAVPMKARGRVIGLLNVYRATIYNHNQAEVNLLTTLANQAAIAIENARLYEEKNQVTQILREILIPRSRFLHEGLEVGHRFQSSMELAGDYYDTIDLPGGRVALTIADVSGKGPTAATYAVRTKYIVRAYSLAGYQPEKVLSMTNPMIAAEAGYGMFISLLHCQVDVRKGQLLYSSGGHEPPLFWNHRKQSSTLLIDDGLLLGIDANYQYTQQQLAVHPGDVLILYTDGVTDCRSESGESFGVDRIREIVEQFPTHGSQALANKIFSAALRFSGKRMTDDFSLMVVRF